MIDVALQKKVTAIFLNSCFLAPMILMTLAITIAPVVSAQSACDVPASNSWLVEERTNEHTVEDFWNWEEQNTLFSPITSDFSMDLSINNDSAKAISMILTTGKSYTFCFTYIGDPESPPSNGAKADVYLMTQGNWDLYLTNYELRYENWLDVIGFLPVEFRDTVTWMPFRDVHSYEKVTEDYFSVSIDSMSSSWLNDGVTEYFLVFDNWDNNRNTDQSASGGDLNVELLVDVENRLVLPKFTAYMLVAILPLSCLIVPVIINSKYKSYGLEKSNTENKEIIPILEQLN
jgi:hypothetical protein